MRKLVLFLFFLVLFLLYSACSDCPTVDNLSTGKILENFKGYFYSESDINDDLDSKGESKIKPAVANGTLEGAVNVPSKKESGKAVDLQEGSLSKTDLKKDLEGVALNDFDVGEDQVLKEKPKKLLDLTLPQLVDEVMDVNIFKYEYKSILPDLFKPVSIEEEEEDRTSFGGRVLMDESFNKMEVDELRIEDLRGSIEGAELTFEVKTN